MPTLHLTMAELVDAMADVHGAEARDRVRRAPDERIESLFGRFPPISTPIVDTADFSTTATCRRSCVAPSKLSDKRIETA